MKETSISKEKIIEYLKASGKKQIELHKKADKIRNAFVSDKVYFRGLIEFSNACEKDCFYCGIRKSNNKVKRYSMNKKEILECIKWCDKVKYGSIVLQSGELQNKKFSDFVIEIIEESKKRCPKIGITLCVGEQTKKTFEKFFEAGAHRYLLRIESSDKNHYNKLHPKKMSFNKRKKCLSELKEIGFQVGTGVMIGSPYQTTENLAKDLLFFKEIDADMIGMGPYVHNPFTPLGKQFKEKENSSMKEFRFNLSLNTIAVLRILMKDINIAATTALQALKPNGRELGLKAGANIIMPIVTPQKYRNYYKLYEDKPCVNETSNECLNCITKRIESINLEPEFGKWGDSKHFFKRVKENAC